MAIGLARKTKSKQHKVDLGSHGSFSVKKGGLHDALGIPRGKKLTASQKEPKPGDSEHVKHMKASAIGFSKMRH